MSQYQPAGKHDGNKSFTDRLGFSSNKPTEVSGWPDEKGKRRKILIVTLEFEFANWKLKVKIGGLGIMLSLMGKSMVDVILIWVFPRSRI